MSLSRRRLLVLSATLPFLVPSLTTAQAAAIDLRALARSGLERDPSGALTGIFGLSPDVADEVLLRATRDDALPDGYQPRDLVNVAAHGLTASGSQRLRELIVDDTRSLFVAAASDGIELYVGSGFRSAAYQAAVFDVQIARWGDPETANRYSARPGYSQHQLGTTLDLTVNFRAFR